MNAIPKSALRLLELQTVPLGSVGVAEVPVQNSKPEAREPKNKIIGLFKKAVKEKETNVKPIQDTRKRRYAFTVVSWLRFGLSSESRVVSLCLSYKDGKGEKVVIVEEQTVSDRANCMLSGLVELETRGPLTELKIACAGLQNDDRCYVEDMTIKKEEAVKKIA